MCLFTRSSGCSREILIKVNGHWQVAVSSSLGISNLLDFFCWQFTVNTITGKQRVLKVISPTNVQMESVYDRFNSYDFESDANFQRGLRNIREKAVEHMLKLKLFYYNRFIEPVDLEGYRQWSGCHISLPVSTDGLESRLEGINQVTKSTEQPNHEQVPLHSSSSERNECLSFAEVFRLVQAGEEVPGIEKLDIRPCKQPPTTSQMPRILKPWESNEYISRDFSKERMKET